MVLSSFPPLLAFLGRRSRYLAESLSMLRLAALTLEVDIRSHLVSPLSFARTTIPQLPAPANPNRQPQPLSLLSHCTPLILRQLLQPLNDVPVFIPWPQRGPRTTRAIITSSTLSFRISSIEPSHMQDLDLFVGCGMELPC